MHYKGGSNMNTLNLDKLSGGLFSLFGLALLYILIPYQVEMIESDGLTPQTLPVALAWLLVVIGGIHALIANKSDIKIGKEANKVILLSGIFASFIYLSSLFQFIYLSPLLAFLLMKIMREKRHSWLLLGTFCIPFCIWLCVDVLLGRKII
ncbi:hypothetical protein CBF23_008535 [Marinomonas agarivorans]|nr:hypothetical protein CBF23_008535 [Marinomonas agarivorans]